MNKDFKMTATTLKGLEGVLAEELKKLGAQDIKEGITKTQGGLMLSKTQREDIRYVRAKILEPSDEALKAGLTKDLIVFYDKHAGHFVHIKNVAYKLISMNDVVVVDD